MVNLVHSTLKKEEHARQDTYEKQKKAFEPLIEELEELREEVIEAAAPPVVPALPAPPEQQALPAPAAPAPVELVVEPNQGFTPEELQMLTESGLPTPNEAFQRGTEKEARIAAANLNKKLGGKKSKTKVGSPQRAEIDKKIALNKKFVKRAETIFDGRATIHPQQGQGVRRKRGGTIYYTGPGDLLDRLEILGGSIKGGNTSRQVKQEVSDIAHKLRDLGEVTNDQLIALLHDYVT